MILKCCHQNIYLQLNTIIPGFPGGASSKEPACQCKRHRRRGSIPGSGRSPGGGHGKPFQYSCLENHMDRRVWQATVHRVTKSQTQLKWLSTNSATLENNNSTFFAWFPRTSITWVQCTFSSVSTHFLTKTIFYILGSHSQLLTRISWKTWNIIFRVPFRSIKSDFL